MSQDIFEIVQKMDARDVETQLAFQCAPVITGLKISNLFIVPNENVHHVESLLEGTDLSFRILVCTGKKTTFLLYRERELREYLAEQKVKCFLRKMGYYAMELEDILPKCCESYESCMNHRGAFPHEMGILLGYPVEDVEGFIVHGGRNFLYSGYWKVYADLPQKKRMFRKFDAAKETLIHMVSNGISMTDIIDIYNDGLRELAV